MRTRPTPFSTLRVATATSHARADKKAKLPACVQCRSASNTFVTIQGGRRMSWVRAGLMAANRYSWSDATTSGEMPGTGRTNCSLPES